MTPDQFAYWLQGFTELHGEPPTPEQWQSIKEHLSLVFVKVTAPLGPAVRLDDLPASTPFVWSDKWMSPVSTKCASAGGQADPSIRVYC